MSDREELEQAIADVEAQRAALGDKSADTILEGLRRQLAELDEEAVRSGTESSSTPVARERRVVTILFCDVVGSTALAETMDPETWTEIMNAAFELLVEPIDTYDGMVNQLLGDAVLAYFGAPTAHEDDPQRAVLAGLEMLENIQPFRQQLQREKNLDFNIRIGINTGLAVVGEIGSAWHGAYSAMGDAVNVAARMEQTAKPGTVQIAHDTYSLIAPLFDVEALGGVSVKGKRNPVPAYRVLRRKSEPARLRGLTGHGISSSLVGRDEEFAAAQAALTRLQQGQGGILAILGEAGIGKSRLLSELRAAASEQFTVDSSQLTPEGGQRPTTNDQTPATDDQSPAPSPQPPMNHSQLAIGNSQLVWLEGHAPSYGQAISYWPFREILRSYAGIEEEDHEAEAWSKLDKRVRALMRDETAEVLPFLASLLSINVGEEYVERVQYLDGEGLGRQVYRASRLFIRRLTAERPLALVLEDAHWLDASSAGLLEHLLPLTEQTPLMICVLSRNYFDSPAANLLEVAKSEYADRYTGVALAPLSLKHSEHLLHNLVKNDVLPRNLSQMVMASADGNPFYLEEIIRNLIDTGALVQDAGTGQWRISDRVGQVTVPDTIQGLLLARIDRLGGELKQVVRHAAVIGRSFPYRILSAVVDDDGALEQALHELERVELIREERRQPELVYTFKHALAQEVAYESILLQERRQLHARVGAEIESLFSDRLDEFYSVLAHHYSAAEEWDKAQEYLFKAGDQAGRMAADAEALAHYRQAMEAYTRVRGDDWDPLERARLDRKIGEALYRLGKHEEARPYLERSLALLGEELPGSRWGTRLAILGALLTQVGHRLLPRLFVRSMGGDPAPEAEEIFLASQALGWVELLANPVRYLLLAVTALNASERGGYAYGSAHLAATVGLAADFVGQYRLAETYYRLSSQYAEQIAPYRPMYQLELGLATHFDLLGDTRKQREHGLRAAKIAQNAGDLRAWGGAKVLVALSFWARGRFEQGVAVCQELINFAEESSDRQIACWALLVQGNCQRRLGRVRESIVSLQHSLEIAEALPDHPTAASATGWLGRSYLAQGEIRRALEVLEAFRAAGESLGSVFVGIALAEAYLEKAEGAGDDEKVTWLKKAGIECRKTVRASKRSHGVDGFDALMLQGRYEWLNGKPAEARKAWHRAQVKAREYGDPYLRGMIHMEMGRRLGERDRLLRAESILDEIGAELELKVTRKALREIDNG